jgi:hypothetical protein
MNDARVAVKPHGRQQSAFARNAALPRVMDVSATDLNRQAQHLAPTDDERPGFRDDPVRFSWHLLRVCRPNSVCRALQHMTAPCRG